MNSPQKNYALIAVGSCPTFPQGLCYAIPENLKDDITIGIIVRIPLGKRIELGVIILLSPVPLLLPEDFDLSAIKEIISIESQEFILDEQSLLLFKRTAQYYFYSTGSLIFDSMPKISKSKQLPLFQEGLNLPWPFHLTPEHHDIITKISQDALIPIKYEKYLIHGVTGSGKSFIFYELIKKVLKENKTIQFLVPEINLTPQFVKLFSNYVDVPVYLFHGSLTPKEKFLIWKYFQQDETPKILIGARSSVFVPIKNLGMIIIDEEHEAAYKQDSYCTYHAREVSILKAKIFQVPVVMASATPSISSYFSCKNYFTLKKRYKDSPMAKIQLATCEKDENSPLWPITGEIKDEIQKVLDLQYQVLIFVNQLGHASFIKCIQCAYNFECINCSVKLRYFKTKKVLKCHICNWQREMPQVCPNCSCENLMHKGFGTERIQTLMEGLFPDYKIGRFDRDELKNIASINNQLEKFHNQELNILIGTQMMAKGHNFLKVGLVLVLGIDSLLNRPQLNSSELAYSLLHQLAGRAGRFVNKEKDFESKVIIQTMDPQNPIFTQWEDFDAFYKRELSIREMVKLPPYAFMVSISWGHKQSQIAFESAIGSKKFMERFANLQRIHFLGPMAQNVEKKQNYFYFELQIVSTSYPDLVYCVDRYRKEYKNKSMVQVQIIMDP